MAMTGEQRRVIRTPRGVATILFISLLLMLSVAWSGVQAAGTTWYVDRVGDSVSDGDLVTQRGTLRFALAHAAYGDFVSFQEFDLIAEKIFVTAPLIVPDGVSVGQTRAETCGNYMQPLAVLQATSGSVNPVVSLGAGATFRGFDIAGGDISLKVTGADADVCGVGLGVLWDDDGVLINMPPARAALIIDGSAARVTRSAFNGAIVVGANGTDSQIGDSVTGSGDANIGFCGTQGQCPVSVLGGAGGAAQRVTIRDSFPRALVGMSGVGVLGGDDDPTHVNNWARTPAIDSAYTSDNFASVRITGTANPLSVVDIFFTHQGTITRQTPVVANAAGSFVFSGPLPGSPVQVFAVSTLNDATYPNRVGSSSQLSGNVTVEPGIAPPLTPRVYLPLLVRG